MMTYNMQRILALGALVLLTTIAGAALILDDRNNQPNGCTMEAKICPDGTAVGRSGPNCEFTECPNEGGENLREEVKTLKVGDSEPFNATSILLKSVSDSRCATGNTCIWAGEAKAIFTWEGAPNDMIDVEAEIGKPIYITFVRLTVEQIDPYPQADKPIAQDEYRVRVRFQW